MIGNIDTKTLKQKENKIMELFSNKDKYVILSNLKKIHIYGK